MSIDYPTEEPNPPASSEAEAKAWQEYLEAREVTQAAHWRLYKGTDPNGTARQEWREAEILENRAWNRYFAEVPKPLEPHFTEAPTP